MKIAIVVGTRPEVIKMASVIKACEKNGHDFIIIHSNQHYSANMDEIFFQELNLPAPKYNLHVGSGTHSNQTGNILIKIDPIIEKEKPDVLLVQGDTNTVLASALAASKAGVKLGHIEAGLRSYDRTMPEETNRIVTDHLSDYLFAVTNVQKEILINEGMAQHKIHVVGNTVVDAVVSNIKISNEKSKILESVGVKKGEYFLVTAHRASNVDSEESLNELVTLLKKVQVEFKYPIVWPIHPRTLVKTKEYKIEIPSSIKLIEPQGYIDFLSLTGNSKIVLTDSGGLQEEACSLKIPCITLRENTERPETVTVGANILVGLDADACVVAIKKMLDKPLNWENPYGDGKTGEKILNIIFSNKGM